MGGEEVGGEVEDAESGKSTVRQAAASKDMGENIRKKNEGRTKQRIQDWPLYFLS